jgi:multiple sugar transport system ATP-binding protein
LRRNVVAEILLENIKKYFGKVAALKGINLHINDKEFLTLLGPSGCGKTTTLNILAGLETADEGEVYIDNKNVTRLPPRQRNIAMAFQNYALYPHKTTYENLAFPLRARGRGFTREQIDKKVRETARLLDIEKLLDRYPRELSGGQQQRVSIGRSLVRNPTVFLMDEPLSNLDARLRLKMRTELKDLHSTMKCTIVYVTHDQAEAMTLSSRIALFREGEIQQVDTPDNLYHKPKTKFIANFLGEREMNLYPVTLEKKNGVCRLAGEFGVIEYAIPDDVFRSIPPGIPLELGVRTEDVSISLQPREKFAPTRLRLVEPMGSHLFLHLEAGTGNAELVAKAASDMEAEKGDTVYFSFEKIYLFRTSDGNCIFAPGMDSGKRRRG